jgi:hypothetical protein
MTLARASESPPLKQYYEELALKFAEKAANERDPDPAAAVPTARRLISHGQFIRVLFRLVGKVRKPLGELIAPRED